MASLYLLNKPYGVLSQFRDGEGRTTLKSLIDVPAIYPAGRLDQDSEGLLLLTGDGSLQHRIAHPSQKLPKTYWVQVEGDISSDAVKQLATGVELKDGPTRPAKASIMPEPDIWPRIPPIRHRLNDCTSWLSLTISEGRNRQVRRMTAAVGFPTLRLIRYSIGSWTLDGLAPGSWRKEQVNLPQMPDKARRKPAKNRRTRR